MAGMYYQPWAATIHRWGSNASRTFLFRACFDQRAWDLLPTAAFATSRKYRNRAKQQLRTGPQKHFITGTLEVSKNTLVLDYHRSYKTPAALKISGKKLPAKSFPRKFR